MVDITAQFNWWRRWQPQAGWWGAEGSHTYGPLVLVGLVVRVMVFNGSGR